MNQRDCECHKCIRVNELGHDDPCFGFIPLSSYKMILCPECGNKRCPKASDHNNKCSGSNDPGQRGSFY